MVSLYYGLKKLGTADFICTNGDYQSYNVYSRVLAGQVPTRDFINYLGTGSILLCVPLLSLHNTFSFSIFVTNFVACLLFIILVFVVFYLITGDELLSALFSVLLPKLIFNNIFTRFLPVVGYACDYYVGLLSSPQNSFRIARVFLPVLQVLVFSVLIYFFRRKTPDLSVRKAAQSVKGALIIGIIGGLGITWSNDYGFASLGSLSVVMLILAIADLCETKAFSRAFKRFLGYFPGLLLGGFTAVFICSGGHVGKYISVTANISKWQFWYYGNSRGKICSIPQLFTDITGITKFSFLVYFIAMGYCLYRLIKKTETNRMILYVHLFTSVFASQLLYLIGSGNDEFCEAVFTVVFISAFALIARLLSSFARRFSLSRVLRYSALALFSVYALYTAVKACPLIIAAQEKDYVNSTSYVAELDGVNMFADELYEMKDMVEGVPYFSTYATALNDMTDCPQPTGYDYIIHALGDESFEAYLTDFNTNNYPYVQTTNSIAWPWERWTSKASWPFYKELYSNYDYCSDHGNWTMWKYNGEDAHVADTSATVSFCSNEDGSVTVKVNTEAKEPMYASVALSFKNHYISNLYRLVTYQNAVFVDDRAIPPFDGYYLPREVNRREIGIYVDNGYGEVTLRGEPLECTELEIVDLEVVECIEIQKNYITG